jgi:hypothetical protein
VESGTDSEGDCKIIKMDDCSDTEEDEDAETSPSVKP